MQVPVGFAIQLGMKRLDRIFHIIYPCRAVTAGSAMTSLPATMEGVIAHAFNVIV